ILPANRLLLPWVLARARKTKFDPLPNALTVSRRSPMNTAIEMNQTINSTNAQKEPSMIVFSKERKDAIHAMKAIIKNKDAYSHAHFVLYSALRGQDIRKTSHMLHG